MCYRKENQYIRLLIQHIKSRPELYRSFDYSYRTQKYSLKDVLRDITYILRTGISYRNLRSKIKWQTVYKVYRKLVKHKIFETSYRELLSRYVRKAGRNKLRIISSDTSFVRNRNGKEGYGYNKYYSKKNGNKISIIVDRKGFPLDIRICKGNRNDSEILWKQLSEWRLIQDNHLEPYINYFLADAGYDSNRLKDLIMKSGYRYLIVQNKRNTKNVELIKAFTKEERMIYRKRMVVENTFCKMRTFRRVDQRYDSLSATFEGYVLMCLTMIYC